MIFTATLLFTFVTLALPFLGVVTLMLILSSSGVILINNGGNTEDENNLWS